MAEVCALPSALLVNYVTQQHKNATQNDDDDDDGRSSQTKIKGRLVGMLVGS